MNDLNDPQPIDRLLTLSEPDGDWPDYPSQYGLTAEHIPDLIRLAEDTFRLEDEGEEDPRVYANLHAWRALGQLGALEALPNLMKLCAWVDEYGDEWAAEELPRVFGLLGVGAIPALSAYVTGQENGLWARAVACDGLECIATAFPDSTPVCAGILAEALAGYAQNDPTLNASIIVPLMHLRQPDTYPLVEEAFKADRVDLIMMGDWEDFQVEVGLLEERITEPEYGWLPPDLDEQDDDFSHPAQSKNAAKKEKNKRKQEKQSRKQNRKKKKK